MIKMYIFYFYVSFLMLFPWTDDKVTEENGGQSGFFFFFFLNNSAPEFFVLLFQAVDLLLWNARGSMPD